MAAYAALVSLVNNIEQITNSPCLSDSLNNKPIQTEEITINSLLNFLDCYNHGRVTREAEDVEREIASAAHAAEDLIEYHIVGQILPPSPHDHDREEVSSAFLLSLQSKITVMKWEVRHWMRRMGWLPADLLESLIMDQIHAAPVQTKTLDLYEIIEEMDAILKRANELQEREVPREEDHQPTNSKSTSFRDHQARETSMVGYEDERIQLMDELTNQQDSRHVISIVGMGGIGKTTLALNLYHHLLIKQYFDIRAWATVSQQSNAIEILSQLLSCLGKSSGKSKSSVDEFGEKLRKALLGRRYLIVLDDLWSLEDWDELRHFFPDNGNRSRVLLTTRLSNVAQDCKSRSCFRMKPLDEDQCWQLLCENVFEQETCPYPELEQVGRLISGSCKGLPLSIVVIGGLLFKSPKTIQFWENVALTILLGLDSKEKEESLNILVLSYNHLPPYLKPCFLYMGVFKEDSEIRASKIIQLWVAEGFLKPKNNTNTLEEIGKAYLEELIDRNLVMVSKHGKNGKIGSCRIHDLVRNLCLKVGGQQELFYVYGCESRGTERRLIADWPFPYTTPRLARSMLAGVGGGNPADYKLLRVWDDGRIESDKDFFSNVNMRYLSYQDWFRFQLPSSVSLIWNLQTLIIKSYLTSAPVEIWQMRQLRHVKCRKLRLPPPPPPSDDGLCMMDNLQTLTTALNLRLSEEVCKLIPNINKLHLLFANDVRNNVDDGRGLIECLCNLDRLHKLESLKLSFKYKYSDYPKLHKKLRFPISLNKLILKGCQLGCEDLLVIGSMPHLQVLDVEMHSDILEGWSPVVGQFLRLKFLSLHRFDVEFWDADNSHFPVLEKLVLENSSIEIPLGMSGIPTLELICLHYCDSPTAVSAVRIKEDQVENQGNDELQVQVLMFECHEEEFNEMLEAEGLTLHSGIQLELGERDEDD